MSRDGNGNYTRVPGSGYPNGTTADGPEVDAEMNDIATALTQSLSKDGQTVPTANLPMGGFRHTNVDDAAARTDYARADQVQDGAFTLLTSVSGADTITATAPLSMTAYATGQKFSFVSAGANTTAVTLNINGIGAKDVTKRGSTALAASDIASGALVVVQYDGTRFQLIAPAPFPAAASATVSGIVELATNAEAITGTDTARAVTPAALAAVVAPANLAPTLFVPATAVELTSGSSVDLSTAVPSWARELIIAIDSVSSSSTGNLVVTLGDSGGLETTGYSGTVLVMGSTTTAITAGLVLTSVSVAGAEWSGQVRLVRIDSGSNSYWVAESMLGRNDALSAPNVMICRKQLSGALTTVNLAVASGTFDGGRAQLFWR